MKKKISIIVMLLVFAGTLTFQSCLDRDPVPFVEYGAFTIPKVVSPSHKAFLDLDGATTVDLVWSSTDADGDPQKWDVYFGQSEEPARVATGHTSQTYTVNVAIGTKYYWRVIGYDANGIPTRSDVWSFEIVDPAASLNVKMSWSTNVLDAIGLDVKPEEAADLRLLILDEDSVTIATVDGSAFEEYSFLSTLPDGKYFVKTDLYSTINAGDFNSPIDINVKLSFNQRGILNTSLDYPVLMTNENPCDLYSFFLATVTKTGSTYTVEHDVAGITPPIVTWFGTDAEYPSEVTASDNCTGPFLSMLNAGWMLDWWGETIVAGGIAYYTIDASGNITIPLQYYITTKYNGAVQTPYYIQGSGILDDSGTYPVMNLSYDLKQGSTWIGHLCFLNYGWGTDGFEAALTLDPDGKGKGSQSLVRPPKPTR